MRPADQRSFSLSEAIRTACYGVTSRLLVPRHIGCCDSVVNSHRRTVPLKCTGGDLRSSWMHRFTRAMSIDRTHRFRPSTRLESCSTAPYTVNYQVPERAYPTTEP